MEPQNKFDNDLLEAIDSLNVKKVEEALAKGANPDVGHLDTGDQENGLLLLASNQSKKLFAKRRIFKIAELLIKNGGANVDGQDVERTAPLMLAVCTNHYRLVKLLLDTGADLLNKNLHAFTALSISVERKTRKKITELLLERGADPNSFNQHNRTPLMIAVAGNNYSMVELLLDNKARIETRSEPKKIGEKTYEGGETALNIALGKTKNRKMIKLLLERGAEIEANNKDLVNALKILLKINFGPK
jgi:ankyrin repeat domain-containing protein 50